MHQGLGCACTHNPRLVPALKRNHVFCSPCGDDDIVALVVAHLIVYFNQNLLLVVYSHDGGVEKYLNAVFLGFLQKLLPDAKAPHLCRMLL